MRGKRNKIHLRWWRETNAFMKIENSSASDSHAHIHTRTIWITDRRGKLKTERNPFFSSRRGIKTEEEGKIKRGGGLVVGGGG